MLKQEIIDHMKDAMRAKDKDRLSVMRLITAAIKQKEVDERIELDDVAVLAILDKMVKQRKDSIKQFEIAKRDDLVKKETFEIDIIQTYLPKQLAKEEISKVVKAAIESTQANSIKDMGKVMGTLKSQLQGKADMTEVSALVRTFLSAN